MTMRIEYSTEPRRKPFWKHRRADIIGAAVLLFLLAAFAGYVFWEYHERTGRWWSHPPDSFSDR